MKAKICTLILLLSFPGFSSACSCVLIETFCETITFNDGNIHPDLVIVLGKKVKNTNIGMEVEILDVLNGTEDRPRIDIRRGDGADCGVNTDIFEVGQELLMALWPFDPADNIIYQLSICGVTFLEFNDGFITGKISPGVNRIAYNDLKSLNDCGELRPGFLNLETLLFPNPTSESTQFFVETNGPVSIHANIFDTIGRKVATFHIDLNETDQIGEIPTSKLPSGVYFVELQVLANRKTHKLIVSH